MLPRLHQLAAFVLIAGQAQAQARFLPIPLPAGVERSWAFGVSDNGRVAGVLAHDAGGSTGFLWSVTCGVTDLGDLPEGTLSVHVAGVDRNGSFVVGWSDGPTGQESVTWSHATGWVGLGTLPGGPAYEQASAITDSGSIIVGWTTEGAQRSVATRWVDGVMQFLPTLPGGTVLGARCNGMTPDGSRIVGHSQSVHGDQEACLWDSSGSVTGLGDLPGGNFESRATDISDDGTTVVGTGTSADHPLTSEAFRWSAQSGMVGLGHLPGDHISAAHAVDGTGRAIVGSSHGGGEFRATLWTPLLGMVSLQDHLVQLGATGLTGWQLEEAWAISSDGNAIAGVGRDSTGTRRAWLAYLDSPDSGPVGASYCGPAVANSTGGPAFLQAHGSSSVTANRLDLVATSVPSEEVGLFLISQTQGFVAGPGGSQGNLCLGGAIGRYARPGEVRVASANGCLDLGLDLGDTPTPGGTVAIQPGETWNFQCWYRDQNPGSTSNFTDGLSVLFQ